MAIFSSELSNFVVYTLETQYVQHKCQRVNSIVLLALLIEERVSEFCLHVVVFCFRCARVYILICGRPPRNYCGDAMIVRIICCYIRGVGYWVIKYTMLMLQ